MSHQQIQQKSDVSVQASGNWSDQSLEIPKPNKNTEHKLDADERLRDLPESLEEFTDNLQDTEVPAPAHVPQNSDSERPMKVVTKSRRHSI